MENHHHEEITLTPDMPQIYPPKHQLDTGLPRWSEVQKIAHRARAPCDPGSNGVSYSFRCPAISLETHEGGMAQAGDTNILAESWSNPDYKGKGLIRNQPFPPDQPPKPREQNLVCGGSQAVRIPAKKPSD